MPNGGMNGGHPNGGMNVVMNGRAGVDVNGTSTHPSNGRKSSQPNYSSERRLSSSGATMLGANGLDVGIFEAKAAEAVVPGEEDMGSLSANAGMNMCGVDVRQPVGETKFTLGYIVDALNGDEGWQKMVGHEGLSAVKRVDIDQISGIGCEWVD